MGKNIVVCCDGTSNEFATKRTNVAKMVFALNKDPRVQAVHYHPGVGTMAAPGTVTRIGSALTRAAGLAFGYGLDRDIRDIYSFIADTYEDGDKLFLFGFSRGAYTVRAVASLLKLYGLVPPGNGPLAPYIVRMMWAITRLQRRTKPQDTPDPRIDGYFMLANDFKATCARPCKPHFVGVWDTVSSVGWFTSPVSLPYTANNPDIAIARHAVAIDERRAFFRTNLWKPAAKEPSGPKDLMQVWFPGTHCDVGGGHPEPESGLSKVALEWMLDEAKAAGLLLDPAKTEEILGRGKNPATVKPDADGPIHDSMSFLWNLLEYVPRPRWKNGERVWQANEGRRRSLPPKPVVHDGAWARTDGYAATLPPDAVKLSSLKKSKEAARTEPAPAV